MFAKLKPQFFLHGPITGYPALEQVLYLFFLRRAAHGLEDFPYGLADHPVHLFRLVGGLPVTRAELTALVIAGILDLVHTVYRAVSPFIAVRVMVGNQPPAAMGAEYIARKQRPSFGMHGTCRFSSFLLLRCSMIYMILS